MSGFLPMRQRNARKILMTLREDSATGPDLLPNRVLKSCAATLALPTCLLVRALLSSGRWPQLWKVQWLFPLYKKRAGHEAANYRGIHLTPQWSKVAERMLAAHLLHFLEKSGAYGCNQFAACDHACARMRVWFADQFCIYGVCSRFWFLLLRLRE